MLRWPCASRRKRNVTPLAATLSTWISRCVNSGRNRNDSEALSMLAKGCCGWPRSDRRRRCTVTAGCGHNCSLAGPSKASSRSWCVRIHSLAKRCSCAPSSCASPTTPAQRSAAATQPTRTGSGATRSAWVSRARAKGWPETADRGIVRHRPPGVRGWAGSQAQVERSRRKASLAAGRLAGFSPAK